jgi:hypothetical protein
MPIDKDVYKIYESYSAPATPNKVNHNRPSTVADVKKSTPATSGYNLDVKGQLSDKGMAGNTPVDVTGEEDEQVPSHEEVIAMFDKAMAGLKKHIGKSKNDAPNKG